MRGDHFEAHNFVTERSPDDWRLWPEPHRELSQRSVDRLMASAPEGTKIVEDVSYCLDHTNARFPDKLPREDWKFCLLREIKLDRDIPAPAGP